MGKLSPEDAKIYQVGGRNKTRIQGSCFEIGQSCLPLYLPHLIRTLKARKLWEAGWVPPSFWQCLGYRSCLKEVGQWSKDRAKPTQLVYELQGEKTV